uniref:Ig-like domain-containing protein n=1 Tax=Oryzias latipes TaxID=8090 RepID=A0A3P9JWC8_ORYLA
MGSSKPPACLVQKEVSSGYAESGTFCLWSLLIPSQTTHLIPVSPVCNPWIILFLLGSYVCLSPIWLFSSLESFCHCHQSTWSDLCSSSEKRCFRVKPNSERSWMLQDYTATEKEELTLQCELSKDVPVMWYHDKKELIASKTVAIRSEGTSRSLVLKKVSQSNQGCYECDCGTDKTSANITVEGKHDEIAANEPVYTQDCI